MDKSEALQKYQQAQQLMGEHRHNEVLPILDELYEAFPDEKELIYARALCLEQVGRKQEARVLGERLIDLHDDPRGHELLTPIEGQPRPIAVPPPLATKRPSVPVEDKTGNRWYAEGEFLSAEEWDRRARVQEVDRMFREAIGSGELERAEKLLSDWFQQIHDYGMRMTELRKPWQVKANDMMLKHATMKAELVKRQQAVLEAQERHKVEDKVGNRRSPLMHLEGVQYSRWVWPVETDDKQPSRHIRSAVKRAVWRRDQGRCVECGSKEQLEFDHIIPVSKGGSNTERNIQLLCETCNRTKSANV